MASNAWIVFRRARIVLLGLTAVLALALSSLFVFLLIKEWLEYDIGQRVTIIAIAGTHLFIAIFLYLVIVVQFRLWVDVARAVVAILIEAGGTFVFALSNPNYPCRKIGIVSTCRTFLTILQNAEWAVPGLLGIYILTLLVMHHVPRPLANEDIEALFSDAEDTEKTRPQPVNSKTGLINSNKHKRSTTSSSFVQNYTPSIMSERTGPPVAVAVPDGQKEMIPYRTGTPGSFRSAHRRSTSVGSSVQGMPPRPFMVPPPPPQIPQQFPYNPPFYSTFPDRGIPPRPFNGSPPTVSRPMTPAFTPFMDPLSRQQTPMSMAESMSIRSPVTLSPPSPARTVGLPSSPRSSLAKIALPPTNNGIPPVPPFPPGVTTGRSRVNTPGVRISQLPASLVASPATRKPTARPTTPMIPSHQAQNSGVYVPLLLSPELASVGLPPSQPPRTTPPPPGYGVVYAAYA